MKDELDVVVNEPEQTIWEGRAQAVTSKNSDGTFDILPGHANFITLVENESIKIFQGGETKTFTFEQAVIHTYNDKVNIYGGLQSQFHA
jgi:F0F1-type ATP synthase epsilon subunit